MLKSSQNPYETPKSPLVNSLNDRYFVSVHFLIANDILILLANTFLISLSFKLSPIISEYYEGLGSKLPSLTNFILNPLTSKLPTLFLVAIGFYLNFRPSRFKQIVKPILLICSLISILLIPLYLWGLYLPIHKLKLQHLL
jgi:hypothetical protein